MLRRKLVVRLATSALLAVVALLSNASLAQAGLVSYSDTISPTSAPSGPISFNLTGFNPALGTLTNVTITTATTGTASLTVYNFSQTAQSFTNGTALFNFAVTDPTGNSFSTYGAASIASGSVGAAPSGGFNSATFSGLPISGTNTEVISASNFAAFESASVPLNFAANVPGGTFGGTDTSGGTIAFGGTGSVGATVTVTYTFSPFAVPEPSSAVMLGLGLAALGGVTLRRRSAK
jgi:hypothetical protein